MKNLILYIHGNGGNASEGEYYKKFFPDADIYGFDYKANTPWDAKSEFFEKVSELSKKYSSITLIAGSLGAYFSLVSGIDKFITKAYFISPIVNMESLIVNMIGWAGTTEAELEEKKIIPVDFGDDLSWEYLQYVRSNKISWIVPTEILYGSLDNLQSLETIQQFAKDSGTGITVMEGGEHWFHTDEQIKFLDEWMTGLQMKWKPVKRMSQGRRTKCPLTRRTDLHFQSLPWVQSVLQTNTREKAMVKSSWITLWRKPRL